MDTDVREDAMLPASGEDGASSQGWRQPPEAGKGKETDSPLGLPGAADTWPRETELDF